MADKLTPSQPSPTNLSDELREQARLVKQMMALPVRENSSALVTVDLWEIADFIAHHTQEAVEAAREKAIDDCIAVVRNKQLEDAEELAKRMSELSASQQSTSPNGDIKDGGVLDHGAGMEAWENP